MCFPILDILKDPKRISNYAKIIKAQNKRIEQQIEKVLQLARSEKNKFTFQKEDVDVNQIINEVIKSFEFVINESGGALKKELKAKHGYHRG